MGVLTQGKGDKISEGIFIFVQSLKKVTKWVSFFYIYNWYKLLENRNVRAFLWKWDDIWKYVPSEI